ncbi:hypothetical protein Q5752_000806 [Cryptotrichosporon argae]
MPKRKAASAAVAAVATPIDGSNSPSHTLVDALAHMPPLVPPTLAVASDGELTPPPDEVVTPAPKRVRRARKDVVYAEDGPHAERDDEAFVADADDAEGADDDEAAADATPKKAKRAKAKTTPKKAALEGATGASADGESATTPKKTPKKSRLAKDEPEYDEDGNEIVKRKRKPKIYPKIEYDIPDVERKETNFKGRLGYACLNTVLRGMKPDSVFCSRTCRIASIEEEGMELPKGLALMNVRDLKTMIQWNEDNNIRFMRMSSEMFPFASHAKYGYDLSFADAELKEAGALARQYGHRLTMHPGQFTQLGSPKDNVIKSSVRELEYQCEIMDRMGIDQDGVMVIHGGGVYGDKESTVVRIKENFLKLPQNIQDRLVLENDEICYSVDDLFPLCDELSIPMIFDYHHYNLNPGEHPVSYWLPKIAAIWERRGIRMKQHLSEPRPGAESIMELRAHADRCKALPDELPVDCDLMIEAKDKEQAVFELYRIYNLAPVVHDNLRPPDPAPGMRTKGRKASTKKKTKATGEVGSDGEEVVLDDVEKEGDGGVGDEGLTRMREIEVVGIHGHGVKPDDEAGIGKGTGKAKAKGQGGKRTDSGHEEKENVEEVKEEVAEPERPKKRGGPKKQAAAAVAG